MPTLDRYSPDAPAECDVAVIGGGFGGLMTLARLVQHAPKCQYAVFERRPRVGPGIAYGACDAEHLLNVPAARMGAFAERPTGFLEWLGQEFPGKFGADDFVPRALFGRYLLTVVRSTLEASSSCAAFVQDAVVHIEPLGKKFELLLASGRTVLARGVVLAPGLPQARAPWRTRAPRRRGCRYASSGPGGTSTRTPTGCQMAGNIGILAGSRGGRPTTGTATA
jgi:uncharacterized NAD(P)/FAD-binding protein YdhS